MQNTGAKAYEALRKVLTSEEGREFFARTGAEAGAASVTLPGRP